MGPRTWIGVGFMLISLLLLAIPNPVTGSVVCAGGPTVTVGESGLPSGYAWQATIVNVASPTDTVSGSANAPGSVTLTLGCSAPSGVSYHGSASGYTSSSGTVGSSGGSGTVVFTASGGTTTTTTAPVQTYPTTFSEIGLPAGTIWNVKIGTTTHSASAPGSVNFNLPSGSYAFTVGVVSGYSSSPSSGVASAGGSYQTSFSKASVSTSTITSASVVTTSATVTSSVITTNSLGQTTTIVTTSTGLVTTTSFATSTAVVTQANYGALSAYMTIDGNPEGLSSTISTTDASITVAGISSGSVTPSSMTLTATDPSGHSQSLTLSPSGSNFGPVTYAFGAPGVYTFNGTMSAGGQTYPVMGVTAYFRVSPSGGSSSWFVYAPLFTFLLGMGLIVSDTKAAEDLVS